MAVQVGDVFNFGRLAWQIYELGWNEELNACKYHGPVDMERHMLTECSKTIQRVWPRC